MLKTQSVKRKTKNNNPKLKVLTLKLDSVLSFKLLLYALSFTF